MIDGLCSCDLLRFRGRVVASAAGRSEWSVVRGWKLAQISATSALRELADSDRDDLGLSRTAENPENQHQRELAGRPALERSEISQKDRLRPASVLRSRPDYIQAEGRYRTDQVTSTSPFWVASRRWWNRVVA